MEGGKQSLVSRPDLINDSDFQHHHRHHRQCDHLEPLREPRSSTLYSSVCWITKDIREEHKLDLRRGYSRDGLSVQ
jgi:hypothetical protein